MTYSSVERAFFARGNVGDEERGRGRVCAGSRGARRGGGDDVPSAEIALYKEQNRDEMCG